MDGSFVAAWLERSLAPVTTFMGLKGLAQPLGIIAEVRVLQSPEGITPTRAFVRRWSGSRSPWPARQRIWLAISDWWSGLFRRTPRGPGMLRASPDVELYIASSGAPNSSSISMRLVCLFTETSVANRRYFFLLLSHVSNDRLWVFSTLNSICEKP